MRDQKKGEIGKQGQFYIISAVVIIILIASIVAIRNNSSIKTPSEKYYDMADVLKLEGRQVIENAEFTKKDVNSSIDNYLGLFSRYLQENTNEDFNLIIIYGSPESGTVNGKIYSRASTGSVGINIGSSAPITIIGGKTINTQTTKVTFDQTPQKGKVVNVTISAGDVNITQELPILEDNNFLFILTTNEGFNQYVQSSTNQQ